MPYRPPRIRPYVYDPTEDIARGFQAIERNQDRRRRHRVEDLQYDVALAEALEAGLHPDEVERIRERQSGPGLHPDAIPDAGELEYDTEGAPATDTSFADAVGQVGGQHARDIETPGLPPGDVRAPLGTPGSGGGGFSGPMGRYGAGGLVGRTPQRGDDPSTPFDETEVGPVTTPGINPGAPSPREMMGRGGRAPVSRAPEPQQAPAIYDEFYRFPTGTEYRPPEQGGGVGSSIAEQLAGAFGGNEGLAAVMADPNIPAAVKEQLYRRAMGGGQQGGGQLTPEAMMALAERRGVELDPQTAAFLASDPEAARDWIYKNLGGPEGEGGGLSTAGERQDAALQAAREYLQQNPGDFQGAATHARSQYPNTAVSAGDVAQDAERTRFQEYRIDRMYGVPPNALAEVAKEAMTERGMSPSQIRSYYERKLEDGEVTQLQFDELVAWLEGDFSRMGAYIRGEQRRHLEGRQDRRRE